MKENTVSLKHFAPPSGQSLGQVLQWCFEALSHSDVYYGHGTDNPWDEAVQLVLSVADLPLDSSDAVLPRPLSETERERIQTFLRLRIEEHQPLPYLLGRAWFAGLEFGCDKRAIVPRSPIAELILNDFQPWYSGPRPTRILDLCCGGGCIGLAAAHYNAELQVDLVDLDPDALELAQENIQRLGLAERAQVIQSDLFDAVPNAQYDLILSNPPYVDLADLSSMPKEYHHEPELALGSGDDGLYLTRKILARAAQFLSDHGLLILEVGNSAEALEQNFPLVPFTWLEFEHGGHGVFAITGSELKEFSESWSR